MTKRIIDKRKKEKFMMDDEYLNGQARLCGWQATLVYNSLCRHANIDQTSFPSIKLMTEELAVGRNTIIKGVQRLEQNNIIKIGKTRNKNGKWLNNAYTLLDKSVWKKNIQVLVKDTAKKDNRVPLRTSPCPSQNKTKSSTRTLRKHIEGNTFKETHKEEKLSHSIWNEWVSYRKEIRKKMTPRTIKMQKAMLGKYTRAEQKIIIEKSIQNGWAGLFELKGNEKKKTLPHEFSTYLQNIPFEDIQQFKAKYDVSRGDIKTLADKLYNSCLANGRKKENYKAFLRDKLCADFGLK